MTPQEIIGEVLTSCIENKARDDANTGNYDPPVSSLGEFANRIEQISDEKGNRFYRMVGVYTYFDHVVEIKKHLVYDEQHAKRLARLNRIKEKQ